MSMIGKNELNLSTATMIHIVQEWVDREFKHPQRVTGIVSTQDGQSLVFTVGLDSPQGKPG